MLTIQNTYNRYIKSCRFYLINKEKSYHVLKEIIDVTLDYYNKL